MGTLKLLISFCHLSVLHLSFSFLICGALNSFVLLVVYVPLDIGFRFACDTFLCVSEVLSMTPCPNTWIQMDEKTNVNSTYQLMVKCGRNAP